jgi:hypothetical protein
MPNASRVVDKPPEGSVTQYYLEFWKIELVLRPLDRNMFQLTTVNLQTFSSNPSHRTPRPLRQGRVVSRNIDVALPKQWLRTCESIHPVIGSAYLKGVRVIDVECESRHRRGFLQIHHPQLRVGHPTDVRATKSQPRSVRMPWRPVPSKSATPTHTPRCYPPDQVAELAVPLDRLALYHPRRRGGHKDPDRPHELDILKLHPHAYRMPRRRRKCQVPRPIQ